MGTMITWEQRNIDLISNSVKLPLVQSSTINNSVINPQKELSTDYYEVDNVNYQQNHNEDSVSPEETKQFLRQLGHNLNSGDLVSNKLAHNIHFIRQGNSTQLESQLEKRLSQIIQKDSVFLALSRRLGNLNVIIRASE